MMVQVGFIVALSVALLTGGCGKTDEPPPPPPAGPTALPLPESSIAIAESRTIRPEFSLPGVIEALQQAEVHPEIKARLTAIHFSAGDLVNEGDLLAELDPSEYKANLSAAEAELQALTRDYDITRTRYEQLVQSLENATISGAVGQTGEDLSFRVIEPPLAGLEPVAPNRALLLLGVLAGWLAAGRL